MTRKKVLDVITDMSLYDVLDGLTPLEVIEDMKDIIQQYQGDNERIYFNVHAYGYDGGVELYLYRERDENDREYEFRKAQEAKEKEKKKAAEKKKLDKEFAEYERLRKKFEN